VLVYGDDLAMNVSDQYIELFNTKTLSEYFAQYGIKFTDMDKSNNIIPYRILDDITFLKCKFLNHPCRIGLKMAALDKISVEGAANWVHAKDDMVKATLENAKQACELAHGHGKEYYDFVYSSIARECSEKMHVKFDYFSWEELDERRYGDDN